MKRFIVAIAIIASIAGVSISGATPASAVPGACINYTFQGGSNDGCVRLIKGMVNLSISSTLNTSDPYFDGWTAVGVMVFQSRKPPLSIDGIVGPSTWVGLCQDTRYYASVGNSDAAIMAFFAGCP